MLIPSGFLRVLRYAALILELAGAAGSLGFMLYAGRRNRSWILAVLFTISVLTPFMALLVAYVLSKRWAVPLRATLYSLMLLLPAGSLALYGHAALHPPKAQAASAFIAGPPVSILLIGIVLGIAASSPAGGP
jgi:hypothetical protein